LFETFLPLCWCLVTTEIAVLLSSIYWIICISSLICLLAIFYCHWQTMLLIKIIFSSVDSHARLPIYVYTYNLRPFVCCCHYVTIETVVDTLWKHELYIPQNGRNICFGNKSVGDIDWDIAYLMPQICLWTYCSVFNNLFGTYFSIIVFLG